MRAPILIALLAASGGTLAAPSNKSCLVCHNQQLFDGESFSRSVHAKLDCADCHKGFDFSMHRAKPPAWSPQELAVISKTGSRSTAPAAIAACGRCHESQRDDLAASIHGRWLREDRPVAGPLCMDCHGPAHSIPRSNAVPINERKKVFAARCSTCHENPEIIRLAGLSAHPVPGFRDSVHGRLVALGSDRAPSCFNCHGSHDVAPMNSPESSVAFANKTATCAECHKGASANFAATFTHVPASRITRPIPHFTVILFSWLTSLVLTGLVLHVSLDFGAETRLRWRRRRRKGQPKGEETAAPAALRTVVRFDRHQLLQHWILIASVVTLVATGWPLHGAGVGSSRGLVSLFGGVTRAGLVHHIAGIVMGVAAVYHLIYLTVLAVRRQPFLSMVPTPRDLRDLLANVAYFFDRKQERPRFGRFMYAEKFDYWAVFWGVAIMFGTGLVRWFPVGFAAFLPASVIEACQIAHGDEATLAALALFVWHLYNVHLRPSVFPMSWVWIDGRIDLKTLEEEHGAEYDQLKEKGRLP